jgi:hypothetical protein
LFAASPALTAHLDLAKLATPQLPGWDARRPFLTGRFLHEEAAQSSSSDRRESMPRVLETYPAQVQESLREWGRRERTSVA